MTPPHARSSGAQSSTNDAFKRASHVLPWHEAKIPRSRWMLHIQATFWRVLMALGMFFHRLAPPRPPRPNFTRSVPSTISARPGSIALHFYTPKDYEIQRRIFVDDCARSNAFETPEEEEFHKKEPSAARRISTSLSRVGDVIRRRSSLGRKWGGYPVIINFHGGGFTLGSAGDDARWCATVVNECHAVVVSVDYRLAPEHPFPTAVEDGVDAVLYIHKHAEELGIDANKIALSGFSSGANMACSVPLRLYDEQHGFPREESQPINSVPDYVPGEISTVSSNVTLTTPDAPASVSSSGKGGDVAIDIEERNIANVSICCIIPWYPSLDYTRTREQRRATCSRKDQELPAIFTDLFDESYLHPPRSISLDSPYLSPGVAPSELLQNALPQDIILNTCEWDMLLEEGVAFRDRLTELGKTVHYNMIAKVPHAWDKAPNPWKPTPGVREHYLRVCKEMRQILGPLPSSGVIEEYQTQAGPSAAPRGSVSVVR